jgi:hypothetical protein
MRDPYTDWWPALNALKNAMSIRDLCWTRRAEISRENSKGHASQMTGALQSDSP